MNNEHERMRILEMIESGEIDAGEGLLHKLEIRRWRPPKKE